MYILMPENERYIHKAFQHEATFTTMSAYYSRGHSNTSWIKSTMLSSITIIINSARWVCCVALFWMCMFDTAWWQHKRR